MALVLVPGTSTVWGTEPYWNLNPSTCGSEPCQPTVCATVPRMPWYFQSEGLALRRDVRGSSVVAALGPLLTGTEPANPVLTTGDLDQPFSGGARVLVGHTLGESRIQVEASYFALADFESEAMVRDNTPNDLLTTGNLFSPFTNFGSPTGVVGVDYNNMVSIRDYSTLEGGELNVVGLLPTLPGRLTCTGLFGVRYMNVGEEFNYFSQSSVGGGTTNSVDTRTRNVLWGPQIGGTAQIYVEDCWWVNVSIKGAICNNSASQRTLYTDADNNTYSHERSRDVTSYVGDLALTLVYRWSPNFTTRIGYQAMWVEDLALAQQNFNRDLGFLTDGPSWLDHDGRVVYHGVHAGVELAW